MKAKRPIRILVVDDHFMVRIGLSASLNAESDMEVVAEVDNAQLAMKAYRQHNPDVVLMDLRLPGKNGVEATEELLAEFPNARVLMLSTYGEEEWAFRALKVGARGYVLKSVPREELLHATRTVSAGERYIEASVAKSVAARREHSSLTERELEVLKMIVKGLSNKEIANDHGVAEITIKLHVTHILEKLGASARTQATTLAIQRGIVNLDSD
jgi:DNA-binding NarL/FixJ family response regulator